MKRIVAAFLALILLLSLLPLAGAAFTDAGQIAETYSAAVNDVAEKGVISGFPDGSFQPKGTLTRAQACKIVQQLRLRKGSKKN